MGTAFSFLVTSDHPRPSWRRGILVAPRQMASAVWSAAASPTARRRGRPCRGRPPNRGSSLSYDFASLVCMRWTCLLVLLGVAAPAGAQSQECRALLDHGIRDVRELVPQEARLRQAQALLCHRRTTSRDQARSKLASVGVSTDVLNTTWRGQQPSDWVPWLSGFCGAELSDAANDSDRQVAAALSRRLVEKWSECTAAPGLHAWVDVGSSTRAVLVHVRQEPFRPDAPFDVVLSGTAMCMGAIRPTGPRRFEGRGPGFAAQCIRDPQERLGLEATRGETRVSLSLEPEPSASCPQATAPPSDWIQTGLDDLTTAACAHDVGRGPRGGRSWFHFAQAVGNYHMSRTFCAMEGAVPCARMQQTEAGLSQAGRSLGAGHSGVF